MSDGATTTPAAEDISRELIGRVDSTGQLADVLAMPEHLRDAVWRAESAIMEDSDTPAGLVVAGHGRLGDRRRAGARRARRPRLAADLRDARLRPADVDDAGDDGALRELLGRNRGDARLLRVRRRARREAHGRHDRRAPRRDGPRRRRARDPAAGRLPAARRRRLHDRRRARGGRAVRRRAAADPRDRRRGRPRRAPGRRVGPRRPRGLARQGRRARPARHDAGDRRRRADDADRLPLEDADQRERQAARVLRRTARARPQRAGRLGGRARASGASRPCSSTTPTPTRASSSGWS